MTPHTHLAWDEMAIRDAMAEVLGAPFVDAYGPKTQKTMCERRAPSSRIVRDNPSCAACRQALDQRARERAASMDVEPHEALTTHT